MLFRSVCGFVGHSLGTRDIPLLGGLAGKMPILATVMMFSFMASLGLPGLVGFVAEFGVLFSFWEFLSGSWYSFLIILGPIYMMLTAGYYLWAMQRTLFGKETDKVDLTKAHDVRRSEAVSMGILCALIALFGVMPLLATDFIMPYADYLVALIGGVLP